MWLSLSKKYCPSNLMMAFICHSVCSACLNPRLSVNVHQAGGLPVGCFFGAKEAWTQEYLLA